MRPRHSYLLLNVHAQQKLHCLISVGRGGQDASAEGSKGLPPALPCSHTPHCEEGDSAFLGYRTGSTLTMDGMGGGGVRILDNYLCYFVVVVVVTSGQKVRKSKPILQLSSVFEA